MRSTHYCSYSTGEASIFASTSSIGPVACRATSSCTTPCSGHGASAMHLPVPAGGAVSTARESSPRSGALAACAPRPLESGAYTPPAAGALPDRPARERDPGDSGWPHCRRGECHWVQPGGTVQDGHCSRLGASALRSLAPRAFARLTVCSRENPRCEFVGPDPGAPAPTTAQYCLHAAVRNDRVVLIRVRGDVNGGTSSEWSGSSSPKPVRPGTVVICFEDTSAQVRR